MLILSPHPTRGQTSIRFRKLDSEMPQYRRLANDAIAARYTPLAEGELDNRLPCSQRAAEP
jgi:hypothetical protein